jgi:hypothetical protein
VVNSDTENTEKLCHFLSKKANSLLVFSAWREKKKENAKARTQKPTKAVAENLTR